MTAIETLSKLFEGHELAFTKALAESESKAVLLVLAPTQGTKGAGEYLPLEEQNTERNAPVVVIVVRPTPDSAENVRALITRYRGDDPKAGTPVDPQETAPAKRRWFW